MRVFIILVLVFVAHLGNAQNVWLAPEEAKSIVNPYEGNAIAAQKGEKLYSKLCWTCHGKGGLGDGPAGAGLNPKPISFVDSKVQDQTDGELFWKLSNGRGMMVPYKHSLDKEKRWQLINYIRTLKAVK